MPESRDTAETGKVGPAAIDLSSTDGTPATQNDPDRILRSERFRLLIQGIRTYAIFLLDRQGRIVCWNSGAESIFGYTETELLDQSFTCLFVPEDRQAEKPAQELQTAMLEGSAREDGWHLHQNGTRLWCRGAIYSVRDVDGPLLGFAKIVHDLPEEDIQQMFRNQADGLIKADREKDRFLATLAHELRNPLTPIMNALYILKADRSDNPVMEKAKGMVERQVQQIARLVEDLLDVSRIAAGKVEIRLQPIDFREIVERAIETVRPLLESRRHELVVMLHPQPLILEADPSRLEQVAANLIANAAKYTEQGGRIEIETRQEKEEGVLRIRDNGLGIDSEVLPHIFEAFVQGNHADHYVQGGLGLGLALVQKLVQLHRGRVSATSDGPGKGSTFVVHLPIATSAVHPCEA